MAKRYGDFGRRCLTATTVPLAAWSAAEPSSVR
jgi:hypothetical protein